MSNEDKKIENNNNKSIEKSPHKFNNFKLLDSLDVTQITRLLEAESLQLKALIMTFIPTHRARMVLEKMSNSDKRKIIKRISKIRIVNLDVLSKVEQILEKDIRNRIKKLLTVSGKSISMGLEEDIGEASVGRVSEKEKKYLIESRSMFETLLTSKHISGYPLENKQTKKREYIYFDTKDLHLYNNNITYSVRDRGKDYFITLKIPLGKGILERDEYNASVNKEDNVFDIDIHRNNTRLIPVRIVNDIIKDKELQISLRFKVTTTRCIIHVDNDHTIELSFDRMNVQFKDNKTSVELYEIEIENKTSEDFVFLNFCENFKESTGLKEINLSKYQRIMNIMNEKPTDKGTQLV